MHQATPGDGAPIHPGSDYNKLDLGPLGERRWSRVREDLVRATDIGLLLVASRLPLPITSRLARQLGHWRRDRQGAQLDAQRAYIASRLRVPEADAGRILTRSFELMSFEDLDCWLCNRWNRDNLDRAFRFEGLENLQDALSRGHGALLYGAHIYSQVSLFIGLALRGFPVRVIVRKRPSRYGTAVESWFYAKRVNRMDAVGNVFVPTTPPNPLLASQSMGALRRNEIIGLQIDTRSGQSEDVELEFLNEIKWFSQGSAMMARASGAPLIDYSLHRPPEGYPAVIRLGEPIYVKDPLDATKQQVARIDRLLRDDPAAWTLWSDRFNPRRLRRWMARFVSPEDLAAGRRGRRPPHLAGTPGHPPNSP
jgi:lauroyl/myristoyl acyltransferase